ncbi:MAG: lamin tail domain-containing protein [Candidatus Doudnabacteria bacterium]
MKKTILWAGVGIMALANWFGFGPGQAYQTHAAESPTILISAVQINGGSGGSNHDYIELFNPGDQAVSLARVRLVKRSETGSSDSSIKSWSAASTVSIPAHSYFLWANSDFTNIARIPDETTSSTLANNNGIALRYGDLDSGSLIDSLSWGDAQNSFLDSGLENPTENQAIVRTNLYNSPATFALASHTPNNSSIKLLPGDNPVDSSCASTGGTQASDTTTENTNNNDSSQADTQSSASDFSGIKISEIYPYPNDGEEEFLELVNTSSASINLEGLVVKVGTRKQTLANQSLSGGHMVGFRGDSLVVPLSNSGQTVELLAPNGGLVDSVTYPKLKQGQSYSLFDESFKVTQEVTYTGANVYIADQDATTSQDDTAQDSTSSDTTSDSSSDQSDSQGGTTGDVSDGSGSGTTNTNGQTASQSTKNPILQFFDDLFGGSQDEQSTSAEEGAESQTQNDSNRAQGVAGAITFGLAIIGLGTYAMYKFGIAQHWPF